MFYLNKDFEYLNHRSIKTSSFQFYWRKTTNLLIVFHRSSPYCLCCETNESYFFPRQWIPSQYHLANETSKAVTVSRKWQSLTQRFWTFDSKSLYKIQHCMELYIRKVLKNRKRSVASRFSLRSARFAKYRFLNLHILHFRSFIPCLGYRTEESDCCDTGYVHFSTWLFISFHFASFRRIQ